MAKNIVIGAKTNPEKHTRAIDLRHQMTPGEKILWERLRANRLNGYHFRRQQVILGMIADFYCHSTALVVEVDGGIHKGLSEEDALRDEILRDLGLQALRIKEEDVLHCLDQVLEQILAACQSQTPSS